ncbi:MAG: class I SAM-dependent methyltransferase [Tatlockia sp.]|nr:class I SAM-dependent methyltransferase [Tatlockia sp.]
MLQKLMEIIPVEDKANRSSLFDVIHEFIKLKLSFDDEFCIYKLLVEVTLNTFKERLPLIHIRQEIWKNNFGVPPLEYLLINQNLINKLTTIISNDQECCSYDQLKVLILSGLNISTTNKAKKDEVDFYEKYEKPLADASESFIATVNKQGFMTTKAIDSFSIQFINRAEESSKTGGKVLEIGAAYGVASLAALNKGATVVCNDIEPAHLAVVVKEHKKMQRGTLIPVAGSFPDEIIFQDKEFDAILISRVLHFFNGEQIVNSLKKCRQWLKIGGHLFVVNETPYLSNWSSFLGEYGERKKRGEKWPGLIDDTKLYEQNRSLSLPPLVHWLDQDTLRQALLEAGFKDEELQISYINREGQFPPDMLIKEEGRESVGCNATRIGR